MRIFNLRMAMALLLSFAAYAMPAFAADNELTVETASIAPGSTGTVLLNLDNVTPCFGFQANLQLPEGLSLMGVSKTDRSTNAVVTSNNNAGAEMLALVSLSSALNGNSGAVCALSLKADDSFTGGNIKVYNVKMSDGGMADVILPDNANYIYGLGEMAMSMADFKITAGEEMSVAVKLNNVGALSGVQVDIRLPEGLTADPASVTSTPRTEGFTVAGEMADGCLRVTVSSTPAKRITGTEGALFKFTVKADEQAVGEAVIDLCNITVTDLNGQSVDVADSQATATIVKPAVGKVTIDPATHTMRVGETMQFTASVFPSYAENPEISWSIDDTSVATIDENGLVTAIAAGYATITASVASGAFATCELTVLPPLATGMTLDKTEIEALVGSKFTLKATLAPAIALQDVAWTTSDANVAVVSETGEVEIVGFGTATITATAIDGSGVEASCAVTAWLPGDSNGDNAVNVADVVNAINYIVGNTVENLVFLATDLNGDKEITITDAVQIAQTILNASTANYTSAMAKIASNGDFMDATDLGSIALLAMPAGYSAFQAELLLPEGVEFAGASLSGSAASSHTLMTANRGNAVRMIVFSADNSMLAAEPVVTIQLEGQRRDGETVEVVDIVASDAQAHASLMDARVNDLTALAVASAGVSVKAVNGGVAVYGAEQMPISVYAADGKLVHACAAASNAETIALGNGYYVVKVGDAAQPVYVK